MSKYTTELRYLIESDFNIGLDDYPIYTFKNYHLGEDYRKQLNDKIKEHYYFREIGLETAQLFKRFLSRKMNEIMPYYNQLYESCDIIFNPLWNVDLTETYTHNVSDTGKVTLDSDSSTDGSIKNDSDSSNTITESSKNDSTVDVNDTNNGSKGYTDTVADAQINVHSDTPQSGLTDTDITSNTYATTTDYNKNNNTKTNTETSSNTELGTTTTSGTGSGTTSNDGNSSSDTTTKESTTLTNEQNNTNSRTESYTRKQEGSSAGYLFTQNIEQWRKIMLNIDMQIIDELEPLFMQLW